MGVFDEPAGAGQRLSFRDLVDRCEQGAPSTGSGNDEAVNRYRPGEVDPGTSQKVLLALREESRG